MLDSLIALIDTGEFEDSGEVRFVSAKAMDNGISLELSLVPGNGSDQQRWQIECSRMRDFRIRYGFVGNLSVLDEHPVLLPYTEECSDLYFYSPSRDPIATIGALFERHLQLVDNWIEFDRFLNKSFGPNTLPKLLTAPSGQLASGPVSLMKAYSCVLSEHAINFSMSPERPAQYWDGEKWIVSSVPLYALIFGDSFVVAEGFEEHQLEG